MFSHYNVNPFQIWANFKLYEYTLLHMYMVFPSDISTHQRHVYRYERFVVTKVDIVYDQSWVSPPHQKEAIQSHTEVSVINIGNIFDINPWK